MSMQYSSPILVLLLFCTRSRGRSVDGCSASRQRGAQRKRRTFHFHEKGEFQKMANQQRAKAKLEKLQADISATAKKTGISSAVKLAMVAPKATEWVRLISSR